MIPAVRRVRIALVGLGFGLCVAPVGAEQQPRCEVELLSIGQPALAGVGGEMDFHFVHHDLGASDGAPPQGLGGKGPASWLATCPLGASYQGAVDLEDSGRVKGTCAGFAKPGKGRIKAAVISQAGVTACKLSALIEVVDPPEGGLLRIFEPAPFAVTQRDLSGHGDIRITGDYVGSPARIVARFAGGPAAVIDDAPAGGRFGGVLSRQLEGQGGLEVWFGGDAVVSAEVTYVGVGDVFVIAGQSNAIGGGETHNRPEHPTLKASVAHHKAAWKEARDPFYSYNETKLAGSPWPLVATHFMRSQSVPIGFIQTAIGGSCIASTSECGAYWQKSHPKTAYSQLLSAILRWTGGSGRVKAILFDLGQSDAGLGVGRDRFKRALDTLIADIRRDIANPDLVLLAAQPGYMRFAKKRVPDIDGVRLAIADAWDGNPAVLSGPTTYDLAPLADGAHYRSDEHIGKLADRWWAAVDHHLYGGSDGRGPRFERAWEEPERSAIVVRFIDESLPILPAADARGLIVRDERGEVTVAAVSRTDAGTLRIALARPLRGRVSLSYASGNRGGNVTDSSPLRLPAETFIAEPVCPSEDACARAQ